VTAAEQYQAGLTATSHEAALANLSYDNAREVAQIWGSDEDTELVWCHRPELARALDNLAESFPEPTQPKDIA
jgi:hypothetical protein